MYLNPMMAEEERFEFMENAERRNRGRTETEPLITVIHIFKIGEVLLIK